MTGYFKANYVSPQDNVYESPVEVSEVTPTVYTQKDNFLSLSCSLHTSLLLMVLMLNVYLVSEKSF